MRASVRAANFLRRLATFVLAVCMLAVLGASARADERVRLILNWKPEGTNAPFYLAQERGYFKAEKIDIVLDSGSGSSAVVPKIASGAYEAGFGDINTMMRFNSKNPAQAQTAVLVIYNRSPLVIVSLAKSAINTPQDLLGKRLGAPEEDAAYQMLPAFAKATHLDMSRIEITKVAPTIRDVLLNKGTIDAGTGYDGTAWFGLKGTGLKDSEIKLLYYSDYGVDLYSNAIIVSNAFLKTSPDAVAGLVRATVRGWMDAIRDPDAAIDSLEKHEALIKRDLEKQKLIWTVDREIRTRETEAGGFGAVDPARFAHAAELVKDAFGLPARPEMSAVYDGRFLPPKEQRLLP